MSFRTVPVLLLAVGTMKDPSQVAQFTIYFVVDQEREVDCNGGRTGSRKSSGEW